MCVITRGDTNTKVIKSKTKTRVITRGEAYIKIISQQTNPGVVTSEIPRSKQQHYQKYKPHRVKQHVRNQTSKL